MYIKRGQINRMSRVRWLSLTLALVLAGFGVGLLLRVVSAASLGNVSGVVVDQDGPVAGATVRQRATDNATTSALDGSFTLGSLNEGDEVEVTAWVDGYYIASAHVTPTVSGVTLTLRRYHTQDHPDYAWTSPISGTTEGACGNCHPMIVSQWESNAHGEAISNTRFFSLYNGTDLSGGAQIGPGYRNDFPGTAGTCANCHAPGAGVDGYLTTEMNAARDDVTAGVHCDFCHKLGGVYLDSATGSVYPNAPGVRSQRLLRPPEGENIFFGPYDDIKDPDTYLPLISESQFCAPCHQFSFWGTPIYESYEEWLASPYAGEGVTCQDCHMPPNGDSYFALPEKGGLEHPPELIPSHLQLGASDAGLLQDTITMTLSARQLADQIEVTVIVSNTGAGHHVPTDFPGRHMILAITAADDTGQPLVQTGGPAVPDWGGPQAGLPGNAFAKVLRDVETGEAPVVSYWKQALIESDNRIPALAADVSSYTFATPKGGGQVSVSAELLFRRVFYDLAEAKDWDKADILMEAASLSLSNQPAFVLYLPLVGGD